MTTLATAGIWPTVTDWDGSTGTEWNAAHDANEQAAIDDQCHSATNPTIKPKATTDEVVKARGTETDLDARISAHADDDGVLFVPSTIASAANLQSQLGQNNQLVNDAFLIWPAGDSALPSAWYSVGAPTILRAGSGVIADPTQGFGLYCMKVTRNAGGGYVYQAIVNAGNWDKFNDGLDGMVCGFGAWVWTDTASLARTGVADGDSITRSDYHPGDSTWQWLAGVHTVVAASVALEYRFSIENIAAASAYICAPVFIFSQLAPTGWIPTPKRYGHVKWSWDGVPAVADGARTAALARCGLVKDFQAYAKTAPGGGNNLTIDAEVDTDGAGSWSSMFSGAKNIIVTTAKVGATQPDGTYANRCLAPVVGTTVTDGLMRLNIHAVGNAADVDIWMRVLQYAKPLEDFMSHSDIGA